jgi:hypothetical protein
MQFNQGFRSVCFLNKRGRKKIVLTKYLPKEKKVIAVGVPFRKPYNNVVGKRCFGYVRRIIVIY